jgi:predicted PurR-regulated permease PerM
MYSRTKRRNMTKFDYAVRIVFALLLLAFSLTVLILEPYRDNLIEVNKNLQNEVNELNRINDQIEAFNLLNESNLVNAD